jgi:hypothetical protein
MIAASRIDRPTEEVSMDAFLKALTTRVSAARARESRARLDVDLGAAPAGVRALAEAMAGHAHYVELGAFSMYAGAGTVVGSMGEAIERALAKAGADAADVLGEIVPGNTLWLGADPGGMSAFGLGWADGDVELLVLEIEDPTPDNVVRRFADAGDFLDFIEDKLDLDDDDDDDDDDGDDGGDDDVKATLRALRAELD